MGLFPRQNHSLFIVTGWLLIISLLVLGGILSTFGDLLGSRVGKARLSIFNLRPRRTAVLITVLTGSLISSLSFGFMLLVNKQLRVGLFELTELQKERTELEERINSGEKELKQLENNLIAFRRGDVVISTGQPLATATINLDGKKDVNKVIESLLQKANLDAYRRVRPAESPNRQIILVPKVDIKRLEEIISQKGTWVVSIRSAANVLLGEKLVYAFPEVRSNTLIVEKGEIISRTRLGEDEISTDAISKRIKLLLASTLAEVKRRGSMTSGLQFNATSINILGQKLRDRKGGSVELESVAIRSSQTADQVSVDLKVINQEPVNLEIMPEEPMEKRKIPL